jgi:arylsulfatase A-like enzyme
MNRVRCDPIPHKNPKKLFMLNKRALHQFCLLILPVLATTPLLANRPNLLFVLSDDHRHDFLGCAGHPVVQTPTIDSLAANGIRFRNAFVTTSICAASRATILSGLTERSHGYTFGTPKLHRDWIAQSYPALLREQGYHTGLVGKFGVAISGNPKQEMFDWFQPVGRNPYIKEIDGHNRHATDLIGDKAIQFVTDAPSDRPFCLSISFNAAHAEDSDKSKHYPPPAREQAMYVDCEVDQPRLVDSFETLPDFLKQSMNRDRWYWRWDTPEKYDRNVRNYYRMISGLDRNIGRVLDAIQMTGRSDNTVVIFMGDNGYYKGDRGLAGKWSHFEESLRVPLILFDPRATNKGQAITSDAIVLNLDIAPTLLDYADIDPPEHYQGKSLRRFTEQSHPTSWRDSFTCEHLMEHKSIPKWEGIRTERFTYAKYFQQDPPYEFLNDRQTDPDQLKNLVDDPNYVGTLRQLRDETAMQLAEQAKIRKRP